MLGQAANLQLSILATQTLPTLLPVNLTGRKPWLVCCQPASSNSASPSPGSVADGSGREQKRKDSVDL